MGANNREFTRPIVNGSEFTNPIIPSLLWVSKT